MISAAKAGRHDDRVIAALFKNLIGTLGNGEASHRDDRLIQTKLHILRNIAQIIVQTADLLHDNAQRGFYARGQRLLLAARIGLGHGDRLRDGDIDRGADGNALFRQMLDHLDTGRGRGKLDSNIFRP